MDWTGSNANVTFTRYPMGALEAGVSQTIPIDARLGVVLWYPVIITWFENEKEYTEIVVVDL